MKLVAEHTDVPLPKLDLEDSMFCLPDIGILVMSRLPGSPLNTLWDKLDDSTKGRLCQETWAYIEKIQVIPKPNEFKHLFQCSADGTSTSTDPLLTKLGDPHLLALEDETLKGIVIQQFSALNHSVQLGADGDLIVPSQDLTDNTAVRARIYLRYLEFTGRRHAHNLPSMLPTSNQSVFTHGDIAPRNIMVDESLQITGIIDWEAAGWYPDYWEYINIWKPSLDTDWQEWMDKTAPRKWDWQGIRAARRVLF